MLTLNNVEVIYDRVVLAIRGVSLSVKEGGMVALLGSNGAGKSTTLKSISGLLAPERGEVTRGSVEFMGESLLPYGAAQRVTKGLVHVIEGRRIFQHLTPDENLYAAFNPRGTRARLNQLRDMVYAFFPRLLEFPRRSEEHTSELQSRGHLVCRLLLEKKKKHITESANIYKHYDKTHTEE